MENEMSLFWEIHNDLPQQGPGNDECTIKALNVILNHLSNPKQDDFQILDIGCGPGRQSIALAKEINCAVTAVDNHQPFLDEVNKCASENGLTDKIITVNQSMDSLSLEKQDFSIIWSEGAIYIMGFENGLNNWKQFLKPNGFIAVSEISWFTNSPNDELRKFWQDNYPAIKTKDENINIINKSGYRLLKKFKLPTSSWIDNYYNPIEKRISDLRLKYKDDYDAQVFFDDYYKEIDMFKKYSESYGYVFYIMKLN